MKRWSPLLRREVENPKIDAFLQELDALCRAHGFDLGHEDGQGAFEVIPRIAGVWEDAWVSGAHDCVTTSETTEGVTIYPVHPLTIFIPTPEILELVREREEVAKQAESLFRRRPGRGS